MPKDAAEEIYIENANAKKAFVEFWRNMEAQGYQYGYSALSNVWVGFDGGRSTLAQKALEIVAAEHLDGYIEGEPGEHATERGRKEDDIAYDSAINHALTALRELFQREGIEVK